MNELEKHDFNIHWGKKSFFESRRNMEQSVRLCSSVITVFLRNACETEICFRSRRRAPKTLSQFSRDSPIEETNLNGRGIR